MLVRLLICFVAWSIPAQGFAEPITAADVQKAINRAYEYLASSQRNDGRWAGFEDYGTGQTSLVVLSLLTAGWPPEDPAVAAGLEYIRRHEPKKIYEVSLQTLALCAANPGRDLPLIQRNVKFILDSQVKKGEGVGGWGYDIGPVPMVDESNSQFAALALWEAQRVGIKIPKENLRAIAHYWRTRQQRDGNEQLGAGWGYNGQGATGSMTSAGIASLLMAEDAANLADVKAQGDELVCCGLQDNRIRDAEFGMEWLAQRFSSTTNPNSGYYLLYYLYAVERVGRLTGQRLIGGHDWYREGCDVILRNQHALKGNINDGAFDSITSTSLGLLFLAKGKRQIVVARAQLPEDDLGALTNQFSFKSHDHAVSNLSGHIEQAWKRDLAWQSLTLSNASLEDLMESPVLFISGSQRLELSAETKAAIKAYVEQGGGFIFAEARQGNGCDAKAFEESFIALMAELFDGELKRLEPTHPVWTAQTPVRVENLPKDFWLYGVDACCRTAVIYSPIALSCRWELNRPYGVTAEVSPKVQAELDEATVVGINVVTYATGRTLKDRLEEPKVDLGKSEEMAVSRGTLRLPRLRHSGGDDDTPHAIPRLLRDFAEEMPTQIDTTAPLITPQSDELLRCIHVYISGRQAFKYSDADRNALREFLLNGGILLGDSICASEAFTTSLKAELAAILPEARWEPVPADDPMLTNQYNGYDIRSVTLLDPAKSGGPVAISRREGPPVLERLVFEDRTVCIFSPYDLSCALESSGGTTQCRGYEREDAARIGINMIMAARSDE